MNTRLSGNSQPSGLPRLVALLGLIALAALLAIVAGVPARGTRHRPLPRSVRATYIPAFSRATESSCAGEVTPMDRHRHR